MPLNDNVDERLAADLKAVLAVTHLEALWDEVQHEAEVQLREAHQSLEQHGGQQRHTHGVWVEIVQPQKCEAHLQVIGAVGDLYRV